jgi:3-phenylpropionate/trans-cinnamate dioxygenase alpha subunit
MIMDPMLGTNVSWVKRQAFIDQDVYKREQEQVFRKNWLCLGHESQVANRRDFFTTTMGEEPVIVTRDSAGQIRAFLNTCRHRGMSVCRADKGNAAAFTCSYHAWTYDTTGALIGVPKLQQCYYGELDKREWGLLPVPRIDSYKGLLFGTFDQEAPSLRDYLGDMAWYLDTFLDRRAGGTEVIPGVHRWIVKSNWKVGADNNIGDNYHVAYAHGSVQRIRQQQRAAIDQGSTPALDVLEVEPHPGHGLVLLGDGTTRRGLDPEVQAYYEETLPEAVERLGEARTRRVGSMVGLVYPNLGWIGGTQTLRIYQPRGPEKTEIRSYCLVDRDAPVRVKELMRRRYVQSFGPSGLLEQDDGENWSQVSASSRSSLAQSLEFNYQMGLGHEYTDAELPGRTSRGPTEMPHRSFYGRWARDMGFEPAPDGADGKRA